MTPILNHGSFAREHRSGIPLICTNFTKGSFLATECETRTLRLPHLGNSHMNPLHNSKTNTLRHKSIGYQTFATMGMY